MVTSAKQKRPIRRVLFGEDNRPRVGYAVTVPDPAPCFSPSRPQCVAPDLTGFGNLTRLSKACALQVESNCISQALPSVCAPCRIGPHPVTTTKRAACRAMLYSGPTTTALSKHDSFYSRLLSAAVARARVPSLNALRCRHLAQCQYSCHI